jgi:quinol-cytochrome oxidoreductase complex cytochrome b subunit
MLMASMFFIVVYISYFSWIIMGRFYPRRLLWIIELLFYLMIVTAFRLCITLGQMSFWEQLLLLFI